MKTRKSLVLSFLVMASFLMLFSAIPEAQAAEPSSYALSFDGVNDYAKMTFKSQYQVTSFSAELWFKPILDTGAIETLFTMSDTDLGFNHAWDLEILSDVQFFNVSLEISDDGGVPNLYESSYQAVDNTWQYFAVTFNDADKSIRFYADGAFVSNQTSSSSLATKGNLYLGVEFLEITEEGQLWYHGLIDEPRYYNRVLSASEILQNYNSGLGLYEPISKTGLIGWWKADEGTGTKAHDRSGLNGDSTLTNGATWSTEGTNPDWYPASSELYVKTSTEATLSNVQTTIIDALSFTVSQSSGTSTTQVYCGSYQKPHTVLGVSDSAWTYDEPTKIVTITKTHASDANITITWNTGSAGVYSVQVTVSSNHIPAYGATVSINGLNKTTDLLGRTSWSLPFGDYVIWAYCQGKNQSQAVSINQDRTLGFNFTTTPEIPQPRSLLPIIITALILVFVFIFLSARRRK